MRITRIVPSPVRELLKNGLRLYRIRRALRPMQRNGTMTPAEIARFHKAWGNEGFSADKTFLAKLLELLEAGPLLECGTGATTLLENLAGLQKDFKTYCLEQDPEWARPVKEWSPEAVEIIDAPLRNFGKYYWYDVRAKLPMHFALIVCDGPYIDVALGEPVYSAWRYGVMPWLKSTGRTYDYLLLDDVDDKRAPATLELWKREFGVKVESIKSEQGECAIIRP
jgi:hypothetical protein